MKKNKAIVVLLCILLILAGVTYIDIFGVNPEGEGSVSDINLGLDLAGGVSITYQVVGDEEPSSTDMSDTIAKLQKRVEGYSTEAIVYQEGSDRINIEIPGVSDANARALSLFSTTHPKRPPPALPDLAFSESPRLSRNSPKAVLSTPSMI